MLSSFSSQVICTFIIFIAIRSKSGGSTTTVTQDPTVGIKGMKSDQTNDRYTTMLSFSPHYKVKNEKQNMRTMCKYSKGMFFFL